MSCSGSPETAENNKYTLDRLAALLFCKVAREIQTVICVSNWKDVSISYLLTALAPFDVKTTHLVIDYALFVESDSSPELE